VLANGNTPNTLLCFSSSSLSWRYVLCLSSASDENSTSEHDLTAVIAWLFEKLLVHKHTPDISWYSSFQLCSSFFSAASLSLSVPSSDLVGHNCRFARACEGVVYYGWKSNWRNFGILANDLILKCVDKFNSKLANSGLKLEYRSWDSVNSSEVCARLSVWILSLGMTETRWSPSTGLTPALRWQC